MMVMSPRIVSLLLSSTALLWACSPAETPEPQPQPSITEAPTTVVNEIEPTPDRDGSDDTVAETGSDAMIRQADSHVHGGAELALALDGRVVSVELETPLFNLLGFEHAPETESQRTDVIRAETSLSSPGTLFSFNSEAGCQAQAVSDVVLFDTEDHDHDHDDGHDHNEEHHDDDEDGHDHDDENEHADHSDHKEAVLTYAFECSSPERLTRFSTTLFEVFMNMDEIDIVYLGPQVQLSDELTTRKTSVSLTR